MTDPLKLARDIEAAKRWYLNEHDGETRLIAAALRLAEAQFALDAHEDDEPTAGLIGEWAAWSEERDVLRLRLTDAAMSYELARRGDSTPPATASG